jgi:hypothetical protein
VRGLYSGRRGGQCERGQAASRSRTFSMSCPASSSMTRLLCGEWFGGLTGRLFEEFRETVHHVVADEKCGSSLYDLGKTTRRLGAYRRHESPGGV